MVGYPLPLQSQYFNQDPRSRQLGLDMLAGWKERAAADRSAPLGALPADPASDFDSQYQAPSFPGMGSYTVEDSGMGDDLLDNEFLPPQLTPAPVMGESQLAQNAEMQSPMLTPPKGSAVQRVSQSPYGPGQTPVQQGQLIAPAAPTSGAGKGLIDLITDDPEAAMYYGLLQGGLKTMAAAGTPGSTALGAVGKGLSGGITDALGVQAAGRKARTDKELLKIKKLTAQAALAKARKSGLGETEKLVRLRDSYTEGSDDWNRINSIIEKKGQFADKEYLDAVEKAQLGIDRIKQDPNWANDPDKVKRVEQLDARIKKLSTMAADPTTEAIKALTKGQSEFLKLRSKKHSETLDNASSAMSMLPSLNRLEQSVLSVPYTGGFASAFDKIKRYVSSVGDELGWEVPKALRDNPNMQLTEAQSNELVASLLKTKMGARPSDRDLQFLISTLPSLGLSKEANLRLINTLRENSVFDMKKGMRVFKSKFDRDELPGADQAEYSEMKLRYQKTILDLMQRVKAGSYKPSARMAEIMKEFKKRLQGGK